MLSPSSCRPVVRRVVASSKSHTCSSSYRSGSNGGGGGSGSSSRAICTSVLLASANRLRGALAAPSNRRRLTPTTATSACRCYYVQTPCTLTPSSSSRKSERHVSNRSAVLATDVTRRLISLSPFTTTTATSVILPRRRNTSSTSTSHRRRPRPAATTTTTKALARSPHRRKLRYMQRVMTAYSLTQLHELCDLRGLSSAGQKIDIAERLFDDLQSSNLLNENDGDDDDDDDFNDEEEDDDDDLDDDFNNEEDDDLDDDNNDDGTSHHQRGDYGVSDDEDDDDTNGIKSDYDSDDSHNRAIRTSDSFDHVGPSQWDNDNDDDSRTTRSTAHPTSKRRSSTSTNSSNVANRPIPLRSSSAIRVRRRTDDTIRPRGTTMAPPYEYKTNNLYPRMATRPKPPLSRRVVSEPKPTLGLLGSLSRRREARSIPNIRHERTPSYIVEKNRMSAVRLPTFYGENTVDSDQERVDLPPVAEPLLFNGRPVKRIIRCPVCQQQFRYQKCLTMHVARKRTCRAVMSCPDCFRTFTTPRGLAEHLNMKHEKCPVHNQPPKSLRSLFRHRP